MAEVWGEDLAKGLDPEVDPMMGTWGRCMMAAWRAREDPSRKILEAVWGRPPMTSGWVPDDDPMAGSRG